MITTVCYILRIRFANPIYVDVRCTQGIADDHLDENVDLPEKTPEAIHGVGWPHTSYLSLFLHNHKLMAENFTLGSA